MLVDCSLIGGIGVAPVVANSPIVTNAKTPGTRALLRIRSISINLLFAESVLSTTVQSVCSNRTEFTVPKFLSSAKAQR